MIIDVVRVFKEAGKLKKNAACKGDCLDGGTVITEADLQAALKLYNVTLREGDAVFIHTGWGDLFSQFPAQNATYNATEPGISKSAGDVAGQPEGRPGGGRHLGGGSHSLAKTRTRRFRCTSICSPTTASTSSRTPAPT